MKSRREMMIAHLMNPQRHGDTSLPTETELSVHTDDELLAMMAARFRMPLQEASEMVDGWIRSSEQWERQQARAKAREAARLARRPKSKMTLEQALERAKELEKERMELVAFINTIPESELDNFERLTGMWAKPKMNSDSGYTLSKLAKIFKIVLAGRKDPAALQAKLDAISR